MKASLLLICSLISLSLFADTKVLVFDDLGGKQASLDFFKAPNNGTIITAEVISNNCEGDGYGGSCVDRISSESLPFLRREGRDVYFIGNNNSVYCGQTLNLWSRAHKTGLCKIEVKAEKVCTSWITENDCVESIIKYRGYLVVLE